MTDSKKERISKYPNTKDDELSLADLMGLPEGTPEQAAIDIILNGINLGGIGKRAGEKRKRKVDRAEQLRRNASQPRKGRFPEWMRTEAKAYAVRKYNPDQTIYWHATDALDYITTKARERDELDGTTSALPSPSTVDKWVRNALKPLKTAKK